MRKDRRNSHIFPGNIRVGRETNFKDGCRRQLDGLGKSGKERKLMGLVTKNEIVFENFPARGRMVTLSCVIVGVAGAAFPVVADKSQSVGHLQDLIKAKAPASIICEAKNLHLFLAATTSNAFSEWLPSDDPLATKLENGVVDTDVQRLIDGAKLDSNRSIREGLTNKCMVGDPGLGQLHILVVVPKQDARVKRPLDNLFVDGDLCAQLKKKRKVNEEGNQGEDVEMLRFFRMAQFPPLEHENAKFPVIMERNAYTVIYEELMTAVEANLEKRSSANFAVTGNPGIWKSHFYLYFIHQLLHEDEIPFELVVNSGDRFHKYCTKTKTFVELDVWGINSLAHKPRVLRLIEGSTSRIAVWRGVTILVACPSYRGLILSPASKTYFLPTWSLEELQNYNSLLSDEQKLPDDALVSKFDRFGGVPKFIFELSEEENEEEVRKAIAAFSALKLISFVENKRPLSKGNYSSRILQMVPSGKNFRWNFHWDVLANVIIEEITDKVDDEETFQKLWAFVTRKKW